LRSSRFTSFQYRQAPAPLPVIKAAWFRHSAPDQVPAQFERIVQSWDTASKASKLTDFSVCTSWGYRAKYLYLSDVLRRRMEHPDLTRAVREHTTGSHRASCRSGTRRRETS